MYESPPFSSLPHLRSPASHFVYLVGVMVLLLVTVCVSLVLPSCFPLSLLSLTHHPLPRTLSLPSVLPHHSVPHPSSLFSYYLPCSLSPSFFPRPASRFSVMVNTLTLVPVPHPTTYSRLCLVRTHPHWCLVCTQLVPASLPFPVLCIAAKIRPHICLVCSVVCVPVPFFLPHSLLPYTHCIIACYRTCAPFLIM